MKESKYAHGEAFCLMKYQTQDGKETEFLWNSRDGVTPFSITSLTGNTMYHVEWKSDKCIPDYNPPKGMRIFVGATKELATPALNAYIDKI